MIRAEVWQDGTILHGPFPYAFLRTIHTLSGRKIWNSTKSVKIMATPANIRLLKSSDHAIEWEDKSGQLTEQEIFEALPTQHSVVVPSMSVSYSPNHDLYDHQRKVLALSWERQAYALLLEMGLGKTAILIANAGMLFKAGRVTGVLIIAPKGVHRQWIESEIPKHIDKDVPWFGETWNGKLKERLPYNQSKAIAFLAMNTDAIRTERGMAAAKDFLNRHYGKSMLVLDESHSIKSHRSLRTLAAIELSELATYRRIATGTPIAKNIIDSWPQFMFLDPKILGHRYMTSFRSRYCVMGGWEGKQIVGQKNTEEFYQLIAPHSYRLTKAEALDLPPKIYVTREYEMSDATKKHYKEIKSAFLTQFADGSSVDVTHAATALLRLQQIVCGSLETETGVKNIGPERIDELMEIVRQVEGPVVIWSRFVVGIEAICAALKEEGESWVAYHGSTPSSDRKIAVANFLNGNARFFVSNAASGGVGLNLQGACRNVIYYSNDFNFISRIQSEDRVHRIGTQDSVTYFDLVARKSVDRAILRNLRTKSDISRLTFDEIRMAIASEEELSD